MAASPACTRLQRSGSQCFNLSRSTSVGKLKTKATPRDRLQRACSYNNFDREDAPLEFFDRRSSSSLTPNDIARSINSAAAAAEESLAPTSISNEPAAPSNIPHRAPWPASPCNLPADNNQPGIDSPYNFFPGATSHRKLNTQINNTATSSSNALSSLDTESWEEEILAPERIPGRVFVILFGVGEHQTEGIYSLRAAKDEDSLPQDTVVAFIDEDDALRYATQLEASMDHSPTVFPIDWSELVNFCYGAGYKCRTEARGTLLMPPDHNVGLTDWEKALHLRQGRFQVLDSDPVLPCPRASVTPEPAAAAAASTIDEDAFFIDGPEWVLEGTLQASVVEEAAEDDQPVEEEEADKDDASQLFLGMDTKLADPAQLEALKLSLERLLPSDEF